jgi:hypothetical protein
MKLPAKVKEYWKGIIVVLAALVATSATLSSALEDDKIDTSEAITVVSVFLGALGVVAVPNAVTKQQRNQVVAELKKDAVYVPEEW